MSLLSFKLGGIHPAENKISENVEIKNISIPAKVFIPISQHMGAPASIVVKKKDVVKVGTLLAKGEGFSANIHSSVSGKVLKVEDIIESSGYRKTVITIKVDADEWEESIDTSDTLVKKISLSSEEIVEKVLKSGIVGLGGATFPTHIKLKIPEGKKVDTLVINGVECEPYLTADHRLMLEKGEETLIGVKVLMKALSVQNAMIGIENNKKNAIKNLNKIIKSDPEYFKGIKTYSLQVKYPQGGEKQLIKALLNLEVPSGGLPLDVGCVVQNIATAYAAYEAIQKNKPLIERVVTVTGKSLKTPSNFMARIGIPIAHLIEEAGGLPDDTAKVINGGPMMGKALNSLDVPVVKGMSGILIMQKEESKRKVIKNCIRCARCVDVCPMGLEPYLIENLTIRGLFKDNIKYKIMDCIECGSCSFACPANRALLDYIRLGKMKIRE